MKTINHKTKNLTLTALLGLGLIGISALSAPTYAQSSAHAQQIQSPEFKGIIGKTLAESKEYRAPQQSAPQVSKGAPNILWILLDDVGFGASSSFGGLIHTPTFDSLAANGLRYNNFHSAGVSAPTRAALLTGRNHHNVGMGLFPHKFMSAEFPGYTGRLEAKDGTVAEILQNYGYGTYQLGKWHQTPDDETTDLGPFDRWPTGKGFDHSYGFLGGAEDQYNPDLVEDRKHIQPSGKHLNELLADKAIQYISDQHKLAPQKPFFMYLATGAGHSPHQVDTNWINKYKGKFSEGWDKYREVVFANQKKLGLIPQNTVLPPRSPRVKAWDSLSLEQKKVYERFMEAYAGFIEYTDFEIGRIINHLKQSGQLENTAIFVVIGDNGASKEGSYNGSTQTEFGPLVGNDSVQIASHLKNFDKIGTKNAYSNYPFGWAQATNTPFREWKADANSEGGTRNPLIVHWPKGLKTHGEVRTQYGHVNDLLPTALEIAQVKPLAQIKNVPQTPLQGTSLAYSFEKQNAPSQHIVQYHYLFGSGSIYKEGWKASFSYRPDFVDLYGTWNAPQHPENNAGKEVWELYNLNEDYTELNNLAKQNPAKLKELQKLFEKEAHKNKVYPLINWTDTDAKFKVFIQSRKANNQ